LFIKKLKQIEYSFFAMFSVLGSLILICANDTLSIFLALELQSLSFYLMSAYNLNSSFSVESGLKYFILGSVACFFFFFGLSLIYLNTGYF
jgi:NADH-quinone oxidoreductase subunit N